MANPSGTHQEPGHASSSFNGGGNPSNGSVAPASENSGPPAGAVATATAMKHNPGIAMDWTPEEQSVLEEGLNAWVLICVFCSLNSVLGSSCVNSVMGFEKFGSILSHFEFYVLVFVDGFLLQSSSGVYYQLYSVCVVLVLQRERQFSKVLSICWFIRPQYTEVMFTWMTFWSMFSVEYTIILVYLCLFSLCNV